MTRTVWEGRSLVSRKHLRQAKLLEYDGGLIFNALRIDRMGNVVWERAPEHMFFHAVAFPSLGLLLTDRVGSRQPSMAASGLAVIDLNTGKYKRRLWEQKLLQEYIQGDRPSGGWKTAREIQAVDVAAGAAQVDGKILWLGNKVAHIDLKEPVFLTEATLPYELEAGLLSLEVAGRFLRLVLTSKDHEEGTTADDC